LELYSVAGKASYKHVMASLQGKLYQWQSDTQVLTKTKGLEHEIVLLYE
jgi:hypothetical protein